MRGCRKWRASTLCAVGFVCGLAALACVYRASWPGRSVEGKPLQYWVRALATADAQKAQSVLVAQGPSIIPDLLRMIDHARSPSFRAVAKLEDNVRSFSELFGLDSEARFSSVRFDVKQTDIALFLIIGDIGFASRGTTNGAAEVDMAVNALKNGMAAHKLDPIFAATLLSRFGERAQSALPELVAALRAAPVERGLLSSIADIGPGLYADEVVHLATNSLFAKDGSLQTAALRAIAASGKAAQPAIPLIEALVTNSNVSEAASDALASIRSQTNKTNPPAHLPSE